MEWETMDDLFDNIALRFGRFETNMVSFSSLHDLTLGLTLSGHVDINTTDSPCDLIDVYVGNVTLNPLYNVQTFFKCNDLACDRVWQYDVVVFVGRNALTGIIVDVPASLFPWCIDYFGATHIDMPFSQETVSDHLFTAACVPCGRLKRACNINRQGACSRCRDGVCEPNVAKEIENIRFKFLKQLLASRDILCPALQHLLATCGNANGYTKVHTAADTRSLAQLLTITGRDLQKEDFIRTKASAHQLVCFHHGTLRIVEKVNMQRKMGFARTVCKGKYALSINIPSFGMDDPHKAYSLLNTALKTPGHFFFADVVVRDLDLDTSLVRIIIIAQYESADSLWIMAGWM